MKEQEQLNRYKFSKVENRSILFGAKSPYEIGFLTFSVIFFILLFIIVMVILPLGIITGAIILLFFATGLYFFYLRNIVRDKLFDMPKIEVKIKKKLYNDKVKSFYNIQKENTNKQLFSSNLTIEEKEIVMEELNKWQNKNQ